jgi:hypothetical protein
MARRLDLADFADYNDVEASLKRFPEKHLRCSAVTSQCRSISRRSMRKGGKGLSRFYTCKPSSAVATYARHTSTGGSTSRCFIFRLPQGKGRSSSGKGLEQQAGEVQHDDNDQHPSVLAHG